MFLLLHCWGYIKTIGPFASRSDLPGETTVNWPSEVRNASDVTTRVSDLSQQ